MADPPKKYFSERHGRGPKAGPIPIETFRRLVMSVLDNLRERGYFQEAFGYDCVDAGDVPGKLGSDPDAYFTRKIMRSNIWPYWSPEYWGRSEPPPDPSFMEWDEDTLFDVIEVLHDLVSSPVSGIQHTYNQCGWHYDTFDKADGQAEFRQEMNGVLGLGNPGYELNEEGHLIEATPAEYSDLLAAAMPPGTEEDLVTSKVESAVRRFQTRGVSLDDRHAAVRDLADVLEALRPDMKKAMLKEDESALFNIANGFSIRHNKRDQRGDYDRLVWLRWTFYVYLATIHAVLRVREREEA